jgi:argininosuccinate lyase
MPLGSGAMAGSPYPLDRESVAEELGFSRISKNSMDAVSDRDFVLDLLAASATCMMHLSRLAEELIVWSSDEFGFVRLADDYTTGSSMMPQKRNPDYAELTRGRTGRVYGNLMALLTTLKGLPLTYNRDLQEDKEGFFDSVDTLVACLKVCTEMVSTMTIDRDAMRAAADSGGLLATDYADYLVNKGMPFREAHGVLARIARDASEAGLSIKDMAVRDLKKYSDLFEDDVSAIDADSAIDARDVEGGTARVRVAAAIAAARADLD